MCRIRAVVMGARQVDLQVGIVLKKCNTAPYTMVQIEVVYLGIWGTASYANYLTKPYKLNK